MHHIGISKPRKYDIAKKVHAMEKEVLAARERFVTATMALAVSAFGFVAAFAWRDAINAAVDAFAPVGSGLQYKFYTAIIITLVSVSVVLFISRFLKYNIKSNI